MKKIRLEELPPEARARVARQLGPKVKREQVIRVAATILKAAAETGEGLEVQRRALDGPAVAQDQVDIMGALKGVPPARLRLLELAWQVVGEDGSLDTERASFLRQELEEALQEARGYARATEEAVRCLREMARS